MNEEGEYEFGIYEVYYDDNGKVVGWTESPVSPVCPSAEELLQELDSMKEAFKQETLTHDLL